MAARSGLLWTSALVLLLPVTAPRAGAEPAGEPASNTVLEEGREPTEEKEATVGDPEVVVDELHEVLLEVMKQAETLGYEGRYAKLAPVLKRLFDIPYMAQKSVGRHWKSASEEKRQELVKTFTRFTIANYAGRFDGYSGQSFETLGEEPSLRGTFLVQSRLIDPTDENVQLNYRLRPSDGGWRIIDVYLNGTVSEIALRRSEYSSLIQRKGFDALLAALDEKIDTLSTSTPADQS